MTKNKAAQALGKLGGRARALTLSSERRQQIAQAAALVRWARAREKAHEAGTDSKL